MNNKRWDALFINGTIATCNPTLGPYGLLPQGALAVADGKIAWIGKMQDLPAASVENVVDVENKCITPTLIDCHTHLVYAGNRAQEFEMRLKGATYEDIAKAGGGIRSTVLATRKASEEELLVQSLKRARALLAEGVTTIEIKSGYGLDHETEIKMLRVARKIGEVLKITVYPTFLGAHTLPSEFHGKADDYIDLVCRMMIPEIARHQDAKAVDVFCEKIAFNLEQTEHVFKAAKQYGLGIKCHAEQLSNSGSAALAARYQALSVDHLEFLTEKNVAVLAQSKTTAVLLPGAFYYLQVKQLPPVELLRQYRIPIAIATDSNPGTSPTTSLLLMLNMACTLFRLTPEEALLGVTLNAARALGMEATIGSLELGKQADFVVWNTAHPVDLAYAFGANPGLEVYQSGVKRLIN